MKKYSTLACCFIVLQSCSLLPFKFKKIEGHFPGIKESIHKTNSIQDVRILIIHGVGTQKKKENFSQQFISKVARDLGERVDPIEPVSSQHVGDKGAVLTINKYKIDNNYVSFYSIYWSEVTKKFKDKLIENHKEVKGRRTLINNGLKKRVLNDSFSDFVLYTGAYKEHMRKPVIATLDMMHKDNKAFVKSMHFASEQISRKIYMITGSLGSKIVLDVLSDYEAGPDYKCDDEVCHYIQNHTESLFMLSNQVPLLSLHYYSDVPDFDKFYAFQNYYGVCQFVAKNIHQKINYVSFYDPNDILGYLPIAAEPQCKDECRDCHSRINRSRVTLNNARPIAGIFANPAKSHVGVWKNVKLRKLIVKGSG